MKYFVIAGFLTLSVFFAGPMLVFADEPTITGAADITAEATSSAGAYVTFTVTAADTDASPLTPSCSPLSGTLFALGSTTTVTCTATSVVDAASSTIAAFGIGVVARPVAVGIDRLRGIQGERVAPVGHAITVVVRIRVVARPVVIGVD